MPEQTPRLLSHFLLLRFTPQYDDLSQDGRREIQQNFLTNLRKAAEAVYIYQVYPLQADVDILVWSSLTIEETENTAQFAENFARAALPFRRYLQPVQAFWGFTRPSQYTKTRSSQEIDPLTPERKRYLIVYPFVKTVDWYLMGQEARQGMMNNHIRVGKQYPEILQLLLYSFGLQDQEFVVVYETDDLPQFSDLVYALRSTDARRYTLRDTPLFTGIFHPAEQTLSLWE